MLVRSAKWIWGFCLVLAGLHICGGLYIAVTQGAVIPLGVAIAKAMAYCAIGSFVVALARATAQIAERLNQLEEQSIGS